MVPVDGDSKCAHISETVAALFGVRYRENWAERAPRSSSERRFHPRAGHLSTSLTLQIKYQSTRHSIITHAKHKFEWLWKWRQNHSSLSLQWVRVVHLPIDIFGRGQSDGLLIVLLPRINIFERRTHDGTCRSRTYREY